MVPMVAITEMKIEVFKESGERDLCKILSSRLRSYPLQNVPGIRELAVVKMVLVSLKELITIQIRG